MGIEISFQVPSTEAMRAMGMMEVDITTIITAEEKNVILSMLVNKSTRILSEKFLTLSLSLILGPTNDLFL